MEDTGFNISTYLLQQAPVVVVMAIVGWQAFKYFKEREDKQDAVIGKKDEDIKTLNREAKEDLHRTFTVLQDVAGTLSAWIEKDDKNFELKQSINTSLRKLEEATEGIKDKLNI